jgi:hypothetical protein
VHEDTRYPRPSDAAVLACPNVQDAQITAYFLLIRGRKPKQATVSLSQHGEQGAGADRANAVAQLEREAGEAETS